MVSALMQFLYFSPVNGMSTNIFHFSTLPEVIPGMANFTMSACLLLNDDNHFLIEWLAYHWQTMPLRRLVVATDPRSRTSPTKILKRWEPYMNITQWKDNDFFFPSYRTAVLRSTNNNNNNNNTFQKLTNLHRSRQRHFYVACMRHLKEKEEHQDKASRYAPPNVVEPNWVAFIDVDEFLFPNWNWEYHFLLRPTKGYSAGQQTDSMTIASILHRLAKFDGFQGPCIVSPRLLIGTNENNRSITQHMHLPKEQVTQLDLAWHSVFLPSRQKNKNQSSLLTWDWNWHETLYNHSRNKAGKAILDLSRVPTQRMVYGQADVHRPNDELCSENQVWTMNIHSPLILHHYIGSLEQFTFRSDVRHGKRTYEEYLSYQTVHAGVVNVWETRRWLIDFISTVGVTTAAYLLDGAGLIETDAPPVEDPNEFLQRLDETLKSKSIFTWVSKEKIHNNHNKTAEKGSNP